MKKSLLSLSVLTALGLLATPQAWANAVNTNPISNTPTNTQEATNNNSESDTDSAAATGTQTGNGLASALNGIAGGINQGQAGASGYQGDGTNAVDTSASGNESVGAVQGSSANNNSQSQNDSQNMYALGAGNASNGSTADNERIDDSGNDMIGNQSAQTDVDTIDEKLKQSGPTSSNTDADNVAGNDNDYIDTDKQALGNGTANEGSTAVHDIKNLSQSTTKSVTSTVGDGGTIGKGDYADNDVNDLDGSFNQDGRGNANNGSVADNDGLDYDNVNNQTGAGNANHGAIADNDVVDQDNVGNNNNNGNNTHNANESGNNNGNYNTALNGFGNADRGGIADNDQVDVEMLNIEAAVATSNVDGSISGQVNFVGGQSNPASQSSAMAGQNFAFATGNNIDSGFSNVHGITSMGQDVSIGSITQQNVTVQSNMGF